MNTISDLIDKAIRDIEPKLQYQIDSIEIDLNVFAYMIGKEDNEDITLDR